MKKVSNFTDCQELLADKASDVFAVGNTVYHGLSVTSLIPEARVVCLDQDDLVKVAQGKGLNVLSLEQSLGKQNMLFRNTAKLLRQPTVSDFLEHNSSSPRLYISKPTRSIEVEASNHNWKLLAPAAKLNHYFEGKSSFSEVLKEIGLDVVSRETIVISEDLLQSCLEKMGETIVLQFDRGIAGGGTYFVTASDIPSILEKFAGRSATVSPYINGPTVTLNACIISSGVVVGAPFLQISKIPSLNSNPGGTCGNDYAIDLGLSESERQQVFEQTTKIGETMREKGYRGLLGIDFIIAADKVVPVEVNARPPASVPTFTQLEEQNNEVSLLGLHLLEFLDIPYEIDLPSVNFQKFAAKYQGSKVIFRNTSPDPVVFRKHIKAGVYKIDNDKLSYQRPGLSIADISSPAEVLWWGVAVGKQVNHNIELATMVFPGRVVDRSGVLTKSVSQIINQTINQINVTS